MRAIRLGGGRWVAAGVAAPRAAGLIVVAALLVALTGAAQLRFDDDLRGLFRAPFAAAPATTVADPADAALLLIEGDLARPEGWAALQEFVQIYKKKFKQDPPQDAHHGFNGAWFFFHYVLPRSKSLDPKDVEQCMRKIEIKPGESVTTFGYKFAPMGSSNPGANVIGWPNIYQWQKGSIKHLVYPKKYSMSELKLPMPAWGKRSMK